MVLGEQSSQDWRYLAAKPLTKLDVKVIFFVVYFVFLLDLLMRLASLPGYQ